LNGSNTVVGMAYSDTQVLTGSNLVIDGSGVGIGKVTQGQTQLRTAETTVSALNTVMDTTMGAIAGTLSRSVFASTLPNNSSLVLTTTAAAFDVNTALNYGQTTASNAGLITVNGIAGNGTTFTLSGGTFTSAKGQTYNGVLVLGDHTTLSGTQVTTSSTVTGSANRYNLTVNGALNTGGAMTSLGTVAVTGAATLGGSLVSSTGTQTYGGDVVVQGAGNVFVFDTTLSSANGANISFGQNLNGSTDNSQSVTLTPGTTGVVSVTNAVGNTHPLSTLTLTHSNGATFSGAVTTGTSVVLSNTMANKTITFANNLNTPLLTTGGYGYNLVITGASSTVGSATFNNIGTLTLGASATDSLTVTGGLVVTAPSSLSIGGTLNTSNTAMTLGDANTALTLTDHTVLGTAGGALSINGAVNGTTTNAQSLTLDAGSTGVVSVTTSIGQTTPIKTLTLNNSSDATFTAAIRTGLSAVFNNTGSLQLGDSASDSFVFAGGLLATAPSMVKLAGAVSTTASTATMAFGPITLLDTTSLTSPVITLSGAVSGPYGFTTVGNTTFGNGSVSTPGFAQSYSGAMNLSAATTLTASSVTLGGAVNGP
jgi:hypothetical protein